MTVPSPFDLVLAHMRADGDALAFSDSGTRLTRRQFVAAVGNLARQLHRMPATVGILMPNGVAWAVAVVAAAVAGKTIVPLPTFFSPAQIAHIAADAGVGLVLTDSPSTMPVPSGLRTLSVVVDTTTPNHVRPTGSFSAIIYTSGSTGTPKGVRLGERQIAWSTRALAEASAASEADRYLSILPLSLLLEMLAAVFVPMTFGGRTHFDRDVADAVGRGAVRSLAATFEHHRPTSTVLLPQLLKVWATELAMSGHRAPEDLRFIAVGGAPVPPVLAERAIDLGIPIHEGYGLSECCSVVALNRPGHRVAGTVGRPLEGLDVRIDDGEIVVDGPSVTSGYLGRSDHEGPWRTGDLGRFDESGHLVVLGRRDNMIVTGYGRNVSPEWVETTLLDDARLALACVSGGGERPLTALLMPVPAAERWFLDASEAELAALVARLTADLPAYARPERAVALSLASARLAGLLTDNGRVRRGPVADHLEARRAQAA